MGGTFAITVRGWGPRGELTCESLPFAGSGADPYECEAVASATIPVLKTPYDALLRPLDTSRALGAGSGVVEISRDYSVADLDGKPGNELVEERTVEGDPSLDRVVKIGSDPQGRVVAIDETESGGGFTILERDAKGRIVKVDGPDIVLDNGGGTDSNELSIGYNYVDQRTSLTGFWPGDAGWTYQYDLNGNLEKQTSPEGTEIAFEWDELNRLDAKNYEPLSTVTPTEDIIYEYDQGNNGIGRLASVGHPDVTGAATSLSYTIEGYVATKVRNFGSDGAFAFDYEYDRLGRLTLTKLPDKTRIGYAYDGSVLKQFNKGRRGMCGAGRHRSPCWKSRPVARILEVHPSGGIEWVDYQILGSPIDRGWVVYEYDDTTHRLQGIVGEAFGITAQKLVFDYDLAGNLTYVHTSGSPTPYDQEFTRTTACTASRARSARFVRPKTTGHAITPITLPAAYSQRAASH